MTFRLTVVVFLLTLVTFVSSLTRSKYIKTKVFQENSKCDSHYSPLKISTRQARSSLHCGSLCSSDGDCRRYQFNSRLKQCQLFDSGDNCYVSDEQEVELTVCFRLKFLHDDNNNTRCPIGFYGDQCKHVIKECHQSQEKNSLYSQSSMSFIRPSGSLPVKEVKCNFKSSDAVILSRQPSCKEVDFNRSWDDYVSGFGDPYGNYWIGLDYIYYLSKLHTANTLVLHVSLKSVEGINKEYQYYQFGIGNKSDNYRINLYRHNNKNQTEDVFIAPGYSIDGRPFSTYDRDFSSHDCPRRFNGGWWYLDNQNCSLVNLVGKRRSETGEGTMFWFDGNDTDSDIRRITIKLSKID